MIIIDTCLIILLLITNTRGRSIPTLSDKEPDENTKATPWRPENKDATAGQIQEETTSWVPPIDILATPWGSLVKSGGNSIEVLL
jgi:hypothetical protein